MTLQESAMMLQSQLHHETQRSIAVQLDFDQCRAKLQDVENEKNAKIADLEKQLMLAEKNHKKKKLRWAAKQRKAKLEVCLDMCMEVCVWRCVWVGMCADMCLDMCINVCIGTNLEAHQRAPKDPAGAV